MLTQQFRELTAYLHEFNELQLDRLRQLCCEGARAEHFLCDLVQRFIDEEHIRRYGRRQPPDFLELCRQPVAQLQAAADDAREVAARLGEHTAKLHSDRLTPAELLPLTVFLEQLSSRLLNAIPGSAGPSQGDAIS